MLSSSNSGLNDLQAHLSGHPSSAQVAALVPSKFLFSCLLLVVFIAAMLSPVHAFAQAKPSEYGKVLNLSGKQRMLSQKMSKEAMLVALEIDKAANLESLSKTVRLFDSTLTGLRRGDKNLGLPKTSAKRILRQLDRVDGVWADFKPVMDAVIGTGVAESEHVALIAKKSGPLLKQMNKAVGLYEKDARKGGMKGNSDLAVTINLAGKQRMLTQKMSKEYFLIAYGHDVENNMLSLLETYSLFDRTLKGLLEGDEVLGLPATKDSEIRAQLKVVEKMWNELKPIFDQAAIRGRSAITPFNLKLVAQKNVPLLKAMNKAVGMYGK